MSDTNAGLSPELAAIVGDRKPVKAEYSPTIHLIPKDKTGGRFISGVYLGSRLVKSEYMGKENSSFVHRFTLEATNTKIEMDKEGALTEIKIEDALGKEIATWGFGQMDKFISGVKVGDRLVVIYDGKNGGYHQGRFWNLSSQVPF